MIAEEILTRTFAEHEHLAPDAEAVLAGIHDRLPRRRRLLIVAGAAAMVAAVSVGASVLVGTMRRPAPPPAAATPTPAPAAGRPDTIALTPGWLPPGVQHDVIVAKKLGSESRTLVVTASDGTRTGIELRTTAGTSLASQEPGTPRDVTVNGRPGRLFVASDQAAVVFRASDDRVAGVRIEQAGHPGAGFADTALRIAAALRMDRPERIDTGFTLRYVPAGLIVQGVFALPTSEASRSSWSLAAPGANQPIVMVTRYVSPWSEGDPIHSGPVTDGRPVQGRPTHVATAQQGGGPLLWVDRVRPGQSFVVTGTPGTSLEELYRVAEGIRWTG